MWQSTRIPSFGLVLALLVGSGVEPGLAKGRKPWSSSKIKGTPHPPAPYALRPAFPKLKFAMPTSLQELPGGRMLVTEIGGSIYTFPKKADTRRKDLLLKISGSPKVWHATVHRDSSRLLFVCYSKAGMTRVSRFKTAGSPPVADPESEQVLITWPAGGHNGGCLQFGKDGMLYISTGDGSGPNPPDGRTAAQDVSNLFGCVLRIDVDKKAKVPKGRKYGIPADNPFVGMKNARAEVWAYGLRNPWKFGIDRKTGRIFAADNGWESWEMVHEIVRGGNCGWPIMEGRAILRSEVKRGPTPIRPPVKDHPHTEANSVIGGPVYRGAKLKELNGSFIYGDYITGTIWSLKPDGKDSFSHRTLVDTDQRITAFAEGADGELFVVDYDYTGQIYELVPSGLKDRSAEFPRRLSETGLFQSLKTMTPAAGVVPYDVVAKRWVDGAKTKRWVAIPGNGSIQLGTGKSPAKYPEGTVFVKHLTFAGKGRNARQVPIETQLLHFENGTWHPYTYAWNTPAKGEAADAVLVDASGVDREVPTTIPADKNRLGAVWHFGAVNECRLCHNAGSDFVLGFEPNQLNLATPGSTDGRLKTLAAKGVIARVPEFPKSNPGRLVNPHDSEQRLNDRARSYLHANCSSCHHRRGNAIVSFYLRRELPFEKLNTNKGTGIGTFGLSHAKLIVPGDPFRSVLVYRMAKLGYGRMPYIGSRVVDSRGLALISQWIRKLPHKASKNDSPLIQADSQEVRALRELAKAPKALSRIDQGPARTLLKSTEGALAVVLGMHTGTINRAEVRKVYESQSGDVAGLFETFVPAKFRRKRLGRSIDPQSILKLTGDVARGRLIFSSDAARCKNCHHTRDPASSTGPTLLEIRKKYKRPSELLRHILNPSLKIDDKFATWVVRTKQGKVYTGLLVGPAGGDVVLKTADRKTVRIPKADVEAQRRGRKSLMPEGILSDLTAQQAADLLRWFSPL